ncbi:MAG: MFS transporter [Oscillospiraceae bacterium]|jgi:MFS family permease|nr:MFS transporter [Oscillospiraceae bacterium]
MLRGIRRHPLAQMAARAGRNARVCMITEPLWAIPNFLYVPFVSVYMSALGLSDGMIGLVSTVTMVAQFVGALLSGALTDKLGRKRCTFLFDLLAWGVPTLLWALAQSPAWFLAGAVFNGAMRVTTTSWSLLMVEDEPPDLLVRIFTVANIAGLISGFFAPLAYLLVQRYGLVPTVRGLYWFAFALMTTKIFILNAVCSETRMGRQRMAATRHQSLFSLLRGSGAVLGMMLRTPKTMLTVGLLACFLTSKSITDAFWPLLVTSRLGVSEGSLSIYATVRNLVMLVCCLTVVPRISTERFKNPIVVCFSLQIAAKVMLICMPAGALWLLVLSVVLEALSLSLLNPLTESLQVLHVDETERARMLAILFAVVPLISSPFGAIAGLLSEVHRVLPLVLTLCLYVAAIALSLGIWSITQREQQGKAQTA